MPASQTWPELKNTPLATAFAAAGTSASARTITGDFPPSSRVSRFISSSAARPTVRPTGVEPVKVSLSMPGWVAMAAPTTLPRPVTMLMTPSGMPASCTSSAKRKADSEVSSAGLTTAVQPVARAAPSFQAMVCRGKFHGTMAPTTPIGSLRV
ncbi:hypothetical protein D3C81_1460090 [compost metagenome]